MFSKGVSEKLISEKTGHRSLKALRFYERTQPEMEKAMDAVIADPQKPFSLADTVSDLPSVPSEPPNPPETEGVKQEFSSLYS